MLGLPAVTPVMAQEAQKEEAPAANQDTYELLNLFGDVFERVRDNYVESVPDKKLVENALNGMLTALDPHSGYLDESNFEDMKVQTKGEFGGLGIEVTMENGLVKVVSPIDDTPAARAGLKPGDLIVKIDDRMFRASASMMPLIKCAAKSARRLN
jgi:carboxyl-terminal processing protease